MDMNRVDTHCSPVNNISEATMAKCVHTSMEGSVVYTNSITPVTSALSADMITTFTVDGSKVPYADSNCNSHSDRHNTIDQKQLVHTPERYITARDQMLTNLQLGEMPAPHIPQFQFSMPIQSTSFIPPMSRMVNMGIKLQDDNQVIQMLTTINEKLNNIQSDVRSHKSSKIQISDHIESLQYDQQDCEKAINDQGKELHQCHDQIDLLTDVISKYDEKQATLNSKVNALEAKSMKADIVIFGLTEDGHKSAKDIATTFIKDTRKIEQNLDITATGKAAVNTSL